MSVEHPWGPRGDSQRPRHLGACADEVPGERVVREPLDDRDDAHRAQLRPDVTHCRWTWSCLTCGATSATGTVSIVLARAAALDHSSDVIVLP